MPLMITLRHILIAEATPSSALATLAAKPSVVSVGRSASACAPPSSIGTAMPYGGTEVITADST